MFVRLNKRRERFFWMVVLREKMEPLGWENR